MKTTGLSKLASKTFKVDDNEVVSGGGNRTNKKVINLLKKLICISNIGTIKKPIFLICNAKKTFNHLQLAFTKASII